MRRLSHSRVSTGFTLIEVLMVIAIIAILMGLSLKVMFGLTSQAEEQATIVTVRKVDALLQQKLVAFDRAYQGTRAMSAEGAVVGILASQNIFGVRESVVRILAKKAAIRTAFPQRMIELLAVPGETQVAVPLMADSFFKAVAEPGARLQQTQEGLPIDDASVQTRAVQNWQSRHRAETESAELLYYCLIVSDSFGAGSADADRFTELEVADTDGDGLPEFIDAWGNPLRFYRWPTRLIDFDAPSPFTPVLANPNDPTDTRVVAGVERQITNTLFRGLPPAPVPMPNGSLARDMLLIDPDDPVGLLYSELERFNGVNGTPIFAAEFNEAKYHTPETYHTPLIVSGGPDGMTGIMEPNDTVLNFGNLAQLEGTSVASPAPSAAVLEKLQDNITNRNRRAGARR
jgi:prepilin-type N-terminal cleavage/methylation domain-containing protein